MYAWFGTGAGPWNSFYEYEQVPEVLLLEYPIDVLLEAADTDTDVMVLGAARLFGGDGFDYRRAADRARCPERLRLHMLDTVRRQGIPENLHWLRRAFERLS